MVEQKVYIGKDSLLDLKGEVTKLKPKKIFLIHGKSSYEKCGAKEKIDEILKRIDNCKVLDFSDFNVNPEYRDLGNALEICDSFSPDLIIAVGGGSVIDIAKLTRFFHSYKGEIEQNEYLLKESLIPIFVLPTTAGTGAEATHFAVLYKDGIKYSIDHPDILPNTAFIFPPFTYNNPPYLTACTGFDSLAQAIEAFWNKNATIESDNFAKKAIRLIYPNLLMAVTSPSEEARDKLSIGSYFAGRAINITKTTAPHAFSYGLTSIYGYPHGHAVAVCFPYIMELNLLSDWENNSKKKELIELLGYANIESTIKSISELILKIKLSRKDIHYNVNKLSSKVNASRLSNNPIIISDKNIIDIYSKLNNQV